MKKHELQIPGPSKDLPVEALTHLIRFYEALEQPEEAAKWQAELDARRDGDKTGEKADDR